MLLSIFHDLLWKIGHSSIMWEQCVTEPLLQLCFKGIKRALKTKLGQEISPSLQGEQNP